MNTLRFSLYPVFILPVILAAHLSAKAQDSLVTAPFTELPLTQIRPQGWLLHQLEIMRDGSTGHLDEIYHKIRDRNGWLGGEGDGWEETPYWLDGALPLAYLLDEPVLKKKVLRYVNWTLDHQRPSGYFGPITKDERETNIVITAETCQSGEDWWPKMVMLKVIQQYYTATADKRVIPFMSKYFDYQLRSLKMCELGKWSEWATSRGADNVMIIQWLYQITKDPKLLELALLIESQSFAWNDWLGNRDWVIGAAANQNEENWMRRHAVNIGMALKAPVITYQRTGDKQLLSGLRTGWKDLMMLHGLPMGIFSGDEDLHGNDPTQGVELCAIVETMFSMENISAIAGELHYMDALEKMTFNALPTQTTDDYGMKQYFQIANQVQVSRGVFDFSLPFDRQMNNVFGLRSGYTCCTANMHQGWTKFASHLWYATKRGGLAALQYSPCEVNTTVNSTAVRIRETTNFPFSDQIVFDFGLKGPVAFPLTLRIPGWCKEATVTINGENARTYGGGQLITINRSWRDKDQVTLRLPMELTTTNWGKNSRAIERGPLVYALKLGERWETGNEPTEGEYRSVYPAGDWNFGLIEDVVKNPVANLRVRSIEMKTPFVWNQEHAPIEIVAAAKKIPGWISVDGVAHQPVTDRNGVYKGPVDPKNVDITLIPYGCTKVRVVAFPIVPK